MLQVLRTFDGMISTAVTEQLVESGVKVLSNTQVLHVAVICIHFCGIYHTRLLISKFVCCLNLLDLIRDISWFRGLELAGYCRHYTCQIQQ